MSAPLLINQRTAADVVVVELNGPLVADQDDLIFKAHITSLVRGGAGRILLDLRHVTAMDSGGVGVLAAMHLHVARSGGRLKLLSPSDRVVRVLGITHLTGVFEVFEHEAVAVASFDPPAE